MAEQKMKIEESKLKVSGEDYARIIDAKKAFGWKLSGEQKKPKKSKDYKLSFKRPVNLPYRERLVELEKMYFDKESSRKFFYRTDILNYIFLYLLLLIPGIIYTIVKASAKKKINKHNESITKVQQTYLDEARKILNPNSTAQSKAIPSTTANKPITTRNTIQTQKRPMVQPINQKRQAQTGVTPNNPSPVKNTPVKSKAQEDDFN